MFVHIIHLFVEYRYIPVRYHKINVQDFWSCSYCKRYDWETSKNFSFTDQYTRQISIENKLQRYVCLCDIVRIDALDSKIDIIITIVR